MNDARQLYKLTEVQEILSLSKSALYREMNAGNLNCVHIGKAIRFTDTEIRRYVASLTEGK